MPTDTITNPATTTWTSPAWKSDQSVTVRAVGPGGNGANGAGASGGGGGGGESATSALTLSPSTAYSLVIGTPGTDTNFNSGAVLAKAGSNAVINNPGAGGTGGTGDTKFNGGTGGTGEGSGGVPAVGAGGGGGSADSAGSNGGAPSGGGAGGSGGNGGGGAGGNGGDTTPTVGQDGTAPGGGGGGGGWDGAANANGGTGANGEIKITYSYTEPMAPTIGTASVASATSASVGGTAPARNGGTAVTGYRATSSPGGLTGTSATLPVTVTGLTTGQAYTFTLAATNSVGYGDESSASNSVTPVAGTAKNRLMLGVG